MGHLRGSDARLKRSMRPTGALLRCARGVTLREHTWRWTRAATAAGYPAAYGGGAVARGVLAQEVLAVAPWAVHVDARGMLIVNYGALGLPC